MIRQLLEFGENLKEKKNESNFILTKITQSSLTGFFENLVMHSNKNVANEAGMILSRFLPTLFDLSSKKW